MLKVKLSSFRIQDMELSYYLDENTKEVGMILLPSDRERELRFEEEILEPLIQVKILGDNYPSEFSQGIAVVTEEVDIRYHGQKVYEDNNGNMEIITYLHDERGYLYEHMISVCFLSSALECSVNILNRSRETIEIELITSFTLGNLSPLDQGMQTGNLILHHIINAGSAEGRIVSTPAEMLPIEPTWQKVSANSLRFGKVGSMPARDVIPFVAVEDRKNGIVWAVSLTHGSSWEMKVYRRGNKLSLSGGLADREFGHWMKKIPPGESLTTPKAVLTVTEEGVDLAAQRIVENMRKNLIIPSIEIEMPIIFNELYTMGGKPTEEKMIPMINLLQDKGILYFVIDSGWHSEIEKSKQTKMGGSKEEISRFPHGMKWLAMEIRKRGMIPGIEFEFEVAGSESVTFDWEFWLLKRDEITITSGMKRFWDFRQQDVQEHFKEKVIDFIKNSGFGYIKINYKENIGIGCDGSDSLGEGLRTQIEAVQQFWDRITKELPDIVIENGAFGGSRLVASFMERCNVVSFSENSECMEMPIIAANMQRVILPRQSLIWVVFRKEHPDSYYYYQIASALLGRMCISGDMGAVDEKQWKIIQKGIQFYHKVSDIIDKGVTTYFSAKPFLYSNMIGWQGILRTSADGERILVVIHTFQDCPTKIIIPLKDEFLIKSNFVIFDQWCLSRVHVRLKSGALEITGHSNFDGIAVIIGFNHKEELKQ